MHSFFVLGLSFIPLIASQSVGIASIEAHFKQAGLVPSLLDKFEPTSTLTVNFPGVGDVQPGQPLTKDQTKSEPAVTLTPSDPSTKFTGNYTIFMVDADVVGTDESGGVNRHWLVNGVTITDNKVSTANGVAITAYAGPGPAAGSGAHRYVILIYNQPDTFVSPAEFQPGLGVAKFGLPAYLQDSGMGPLVGGFYVQVEEGKASASVSATSAVVSSTLASAGSAGGSSGTPTRSGAPAASTSSKDNSASTLQFSVTGILAAGLVTFLV